MPIDSAQSNSEEPRAGVPRRWLKCNSMLICNQISDTWNAAFPKV
jgi:hypothetical protein